MTFLLRFSAFAAAACASITPARMVLPPEFGATPPIEVPGVGFGQRGTFDFDGREVTYRRSDTLFAAGRLFESRGGRVDVSVGMPNGERISVACSVRERTVSLAFVFYTLSPMALSCTSPGGGVFMELQAEAQRLDNAFAPQRRAGIITFEGTSLMIESAHGLEGTRLPSELPIGYVLARDGRPVAAVELNGRPRLFMDGNLSTAEREAADLALAVLMVFWDPAASSLDNE